MKKIFLVLGLFCLIVSSCKSNQLHKSDQGNNSVLRPTDNFKLNPQEWVLILEVTEINGSRLLATILSVGRRGFGVSSTITENAEISISSGKTKISEIGVYEMIVEESENVGTPAFNYQLSKIITRPN